MPESLRLDTVGEIENAGIKPVKVASSVRLRPLEMVRNTVLSTATSYKIEFANSIKLRRDLEEAYNVFKEIHSTSVDVYYFDYVGDQY
ncbi:MAG: hypothetical protein DCC55_37455 [Chloroflexi bacterium]|nr:MAG: hypothetical protein DCC55_37455 [Chloroflexota bacterium]